MSEEKQASKYPLLENISSVFALRDQERREKLAILKTKEEANKVHVKFLRENMIDQSDYHRAGRVVSEWAKKNGGIGKETQRMLNNKRKVDQIPLTDATLKRRRKIASGSRTTLELNSSDDNDDILEMTYQSPAELTSCDVINCGLKFEKKTDHERHDTTFRHSSCNPYSNLPNGHLPTHPVHYTCPRCEENYHKRIDCQEHMVFKDHLPMLSPLSICGYMCPQCCSIYSNIVQCHTHMSQADHYQVTYAFSKDGDQIEAKNTKSIPISFYLAKQFYDKCMSRSYLVKCVTCEEEIKSFEAKHQHTASTDHTQYISTSDSTPDEVFGEFLCDKACDNCGKIIWEETEHKGFHVCYGDTIGWVKDSGCLSFREFVHRCGITEDNDTSLKTERIDELMVVDDVSDSDVIFVKDSDNKFLISFYNSSFRNFVFSLISVKVKYGRFFVRINVKYGRFLNKIIATVDISSIFCVQDLHINRNNNSKNSSKPPSLVLPTEWDASLFFHTLSHTGAATTRNVTLNNTSLQITTQIANSSSTPLSTESDSCDQISNLASSSASTSRDAVKTDQASSSASTSRGAVRVHQASTSQSEPSSSPLASKKKSSKSSISKFFSKIMSRAPSSPSSKKSSKSRKSWSMGKSKFVEDANEFKDAVDGVYSEMLQPPDSPSGTTDAQFTDLESVGKKDLNKDALNQQMPSSSRRSTNALPNENLDSIKNETAKKLNLGSWEKGFLTVHQKAMICERVKTWKQRKLIEQIASGKGFAKVTKQKSRSNSPTKAAGVGSKSAVKDTGKPNNCKLDTVPSSAASKPSTKTMLESATTNVQHPLASTARPKIAAKRMLASTTACANEVACSNDATTSLGRGLRSDSCNCQNQSLRNQTSDFIAGSSQALTDVSVDVYRHGIALNPPCTSKTGKGFLAAPRCLASSTAPKGLASNVAPTSHDCGLKSEPSTSMASKRNFILPATPRKGLASNTMKAGCSSNAGTYKRATNQTKTKMAVREDPHDPNSQSSSPYSFLSCSSLLDSCQEVEEAVFCRKRKRDGEICVGYLDEESKPSVSEWVLNTTKQQGSSSSATPRITRSCTSPTKRLNNISKSQTETSNSAHWFNFSCPRDLRSFLGPRRSDEADETVFCDPSSGIKLRDLMTNDDYLYKKRLKHPRNNGSGSFTTPHQGRSPETLNPVVSREKSIPGPSKWVEKMEVDNELPIPLPPQVQNNQGCVHNTPGLLRIVPPSQQTQNVFHSSSEKMQEDNSKLSKSARRRKAIQRRKAELANQVPVIPQGLAAMETNSDTEGDISTENLSRMNLLIFLDLDNWPIFFKRLPHCLPDKTFVWAFYGGHTVWRLPKCLPFLTLQKVNCFHLHHQCGKTKDAADFAICFTIGKMDDRLPQSVPFAILSGDRGFCEIERQMKTSSRKTVLIDPHEAEKQNAQMLYTLILSVMSQ